jgi:transposase
MGKHFGQIIIKDVLRMKEEGMTNTEIGDHFGFTRKQIKKLLERYRKNERNREAGILPQPKKHPRRQIQTQEEKLRSENKQLKMENELLRDFLYAIGRR